LTTPALRLADVVKRFPGLTAVDGVTLDVERGEIFALLGPNGAGKTTLIHCVAGLARASGGTIEVFGRDVVRDFRESRRLVGLVPQEINFDPFFTPFESLMNQMGFMGVAPDAARADALLETFALTRHRDAYTRHLSGGMKRRLNVAKALVHGPKLLFLDEPTAGVDVKLRRDLWDEVRRLRDRGTTIILTTHYLEEAEELADRIGVIDHGRLVVVEERDTLIERHGRSWIRVEVRRDLGELPPDVPDGATLESHPIDGNGSAPGVLVQCPYQGPDQLTALLDALQRVGPVGTVSVEPPRLEDIFVDLVDGGDGAPAGDRERGPVPG